jgi:hypothetical protein
LKRTFLSLEIGLHTRQTDIRIVEFTRMHLFAAPPAPSEEFPTPRPGPLNAHLQVAVAFSPGFERILA